MAKRARNAVKGLSVIVWCALPDFAAGFTPDDGCTGAIFLQAAGENEIAGALWLVDEGDYLNNSVRRYGQVFVARGVIWWPSRWRRTVAIHWQRHCVDGGSAG